MGICVSLAASKPGLAKWPSSPLNNRTVTDAKLPTQVADLQTTIVGCILWLLGHCVCLCAGAVNVLVMSADCGMLATAAQDSSVFLFKVSSATAYEPVGFFRLAQPASCMAWSPDSAKLLIGCR